jgi:hypothetical protein
MGFASPSTAAIRLNRIEPVFRVIKDHALPERTYPTLAALEAAVDAAYAAFEADLLTEHATPLRPAA